jgi:hypothetical protein
MTPRGRPDRRQASNPARAARRDCLLTADRRIRRRRRHGRRIPGRRRRKPNRLRVVRRTSEGKSKRGIIRWLKRYVAREIYTALTQTADQKHARAA